MNAPYLILRAMEVGAGALHLLFLRLMFGPKRLRGPMIGFGPQFSLKIRNGGNVYFGKIVARRNLSIFCDGGKIVVADGVFFNNDCSLNCMSSLLIGEHTLLGEGVRIYDHNHALDFQNLPLKDSFECEPVSIGRNCWIGSNVTILKGVSICDGVIIGCGAVVTKSIYQPGTYVAKGLSLLSRVDPKDTTLSRNQVEPTLQHVITLSQGTPGLTLDGATGPSPANAMSPPNAQTSTAPLNTGMK